MSILDGTPPAPRRTLKQVFVDVLRRATGEDGILFKKYEQLADEFVEELAGEEDEAPYRHARSGFYGKCRAQEDGDCDHPDCPQLRDGEPARTGRSCPLWTEHRGREE